MNHFPLLLKFTLQTEVALLKVLSFLILIKPFSFAGLFFLFQAVFWCISLEKKRFRKDVNVHASSSLLFGHSTIVKHDFWV